MAEQQGEWLQMAACRKSSWLCYFCLTANETVTASENETKFVDSFRPFSPEKWAINFGERRRRVLRKSPAVKLLILSARRPEGKKKK